eukprot:TRINITY_DN7789_c2_g2_i1.p1 TRINITY_DN7789_c2_g2~~TRINITY_DN7789_c2_g2_i1.p1  ORF type:complete len:409 (-),score=38.71 TRINITY_DN7789_c2_g2_i1:261-1454(-)
MSLSLYESWLKTMVASFLLCSLPVSAWFWLRYIRWLRSQCQSHSRSDWNRIETGDSTEENEFRALTSEADRSCEWCLRVLHSPQGQSRSVLLLGEFHVKSTRAKQVGQELLSHVEAIGIEGMRVPCGHKVSRLERLLSLVSCGRLHCTSMFDAASLFRERTQPLESVNQICWIVVRIVGGSLLYIALALLLSLLMPMELSTQSWKLWAWGLGSSTAVFGICSMAFLVTAAVSSNDAVLIVRFLAVWQAFGVWFPIAAFLVALQIFIYWLPAWTWFAERVLAFALAAVALLLAVEGYAAWCWTQNPSLAVGKSMLRLTIFANICSARDEHFAERLAWMSQDSPEGAKVCAIIGLAHIPGVAHHLKVLGFQELCHSPSRIGNQAISYSEGPTPKRRSYP